MITLTSYNTHSYYQF